MATGTIANPGLNLMVDGIGQETGMYLIAVDTSENYDEAASVTFDSAASGSADITANVTITIASGKTIDFVVLSSSGTYSVGATLASVTINEAFTNGGDLIIESFVITAT